MSTTSKLQYMQWRFLFPYWFVNNGFLQAEAWSV